jgi:hypothetical protein
VISLEALLAEARVATPGSLARRFAEEIDSLRAQLDHAQVELEEFGAAEYWRGYGDGADVEREMQEMNREGEL